MALNLIASPAIEPISVEEAQRQVLPMADDDDVLAAFIVAARHRAEAVTGRQLIEATWELQLDSFCEPVLRLPRPPLRTIVSVTYLDAAGAPQTWSSANYQVDAPVGPFADLGRMAPVPSATWPLAGSGYLNAVKIRFTAGYGTEPEAVPGDIRQAMRLMIGAWYENREDFIVGESIQPVPLGALVLLTPYKVYA